MAKVQVQKKTKVLCFHDYDYGRDVQALAPIIFFLENFLNCRVYNEYLFDSYKISTLKPELVLMGNSVGSSKHVAILKRCYDNNIPVFSLTAEGNMIEDFIRQGKHWGWNTDKILFQPFYCAWSERIINTIIKYDQTMPLKRIRLTGAPGFDIYEMLRVVDFKGLEMIDSKGFNFVVGYAGWGFGKFFSTSGLKIMRDSYKGNFDEYVIWAKKKRKQVEEALKYVIESNPDTLFVFKKHPKEDSPTLTKEPLNEMNDLLNYPNVNYVKGGAPSLTSLISSCDLWACFESTTVMEGWLLGKMTINIIPDLDYRVHTDIRMGSLIADNGQKLDAIIKKMKRGDLEQVFNHQEKELARKKIVENSIGFNDGLNHLRTAFLIEDYLRLKNTEKANYKITQFDLRSFFLRKLMIVLLKVPVIRNFQKVKKHLFLLNSFDSNVFRGNLEFYEKIVREFYEKINLPSKISDLKDTIFKNERN